MADTATLRDAFVHELRDSYDAERQLMKALKKLAKRASAGALRDAFESHRAETEGHIARLDDVFELLGEKARGKHCEGMAGIIDEGKSVMGEPFDAVTMDACLAAAGQRVEHYEIAAYDSLIAWAHALGHTHIAGLLQQNLEEERAADRRLASLAEASVNAAAKPSPEQDKGSAVTKPDNGKGSRKKKRR